MKTLFVSDLDGTLLNNKAKLSENAVTDLNTLISQGLNFTYATGRSWTSANKIMESINLTLPVITHNGAFVVEPCSGKTFRVFSMSADKARSMLSTLRAHDVYPFVYVFIDGVERILWIKGKETDGIRDFLEWRRGDKRLMGVSSWHDLAKESIHELLVVDSYNKLAPIAAMLENETEYSVIFSKDAYVDQYLLEIYDEQVSKAAGIKWLRDNYQFDKIICFGDNLNDISMFGAADESYAPNNAVPELKLLADGIIGSNEDDAVVEFIKNYVKSKI